jgi:hypothetical protein
LVPPRAVQQGLQEPVVAQPGTGDPLKDVINRRNEYFPPSEGQTGSLSQVRCSRTLARSRLLGNWDLHSELAISRGNPVDKRMRPGSQIAFHARCRPYLRWFPGPGACCPGHRRGLESKQQSGYLGVGRP